MIWFFDMFNLKAYHRYKHGTSNFPLRQSSFEETLEIWITRLKSRPGWLNRKSEAASDWVKSSHPAYKVGRSLSSDDWLLFLKLGYRYDFLASSETESAKGNHPSSATTIAGQKRNLEHQVEWNLLFDNQEDSLAGPILASVLVHANPVGLTPSVSECSDKSLTVLSVWWGENKSPQFSGHFFFFLPWSYPFVCVRVCTGSFVPPPPPPA